MRRRVFLLLVAVPGAVPGAVRGAVLGVVLGAGLASLGIAAGAPQRFALLVGVSEYPAAPTLETLRGPPNDVQLMQDTLGAIWGQSARITRLSNGDGGGYRAPTRAAIFDALERIATAAGPGDEVLVYLAGHGTQLPVSDPARQASEADGLDEVFLPSDFSLRIEADEVTIANQILDDEFGRAFDAILRTGATLWLVADLCHSGTLERGGVDSVTSRYAFLGLRPGMRLHNLTPLAQRAPLPEGAPGQPRAGPEGEAPALTDIPGTATAGRFIGFYAAGPGAESVEMPIAVGPEGERRVHGVFTYKLAQLLRRGQARSYRALAEQLERAFWGWGQGLPRPVFSGVLQGDQMLRRADGGAIALAARDGGYIARAGLLDGLRRGDLLAIYAEDAPGARPIAHARVIRAELDYSSLRLLRDARAGGDRIDEMIRREGLAPETWRDRWLADRMAGFVARRAPDALVGAGAETAAGTAGTAQAGVRPRGLRVALAGAMPPALRARIGRAARAASDGAQPVRLVPADTGADLRLVARDRRLVFLPAAARYARARAQAYSLALSGLSEETIAAALRQIAKAQSLLRISAQLSRAPIVRRLATRVTVRGCGDGAARRFAAGAARAPGDGPIVVRDCDTVTLSFTNRGAAAVDLSPLYIDPQGRIYYLRGYPDGAYFGLRVPPGESREVVYQERLADGAATGDMQLLVLAVPADPEALYPRDFRYLEGDLPPEDRSRAVAPGGDGQTGAVLIALRLER